MKDERNLYAFSEALHCSDAGGWESWLEIHHGQKGEAWLRIAKKDSGETSVTITEALDVALCFGWIDSQRKGLDESFYLQRYSPRRPKSPWSKLNVERAIALVAAGRMRPQGMLEIEAAKKDGRWDAAYESQRNSSIPADLETALAKNAKARKAYGLLDKTSQYAIILPLLKASNPERRAVLLQKAIGNLVVGKGK